MTAIWLAIPGLPLLLAALVPFGGIWRRLAVVGMPFAALPGLVMAVMPDPGEPVSLQWLLLGTSLGRDQTGQVFLLLTALLWTIAGIYALAYHREDPHRHRFAFFFLLTMAGNLGLVLAQDAITFYAAFALMAFCAYGLVVHNRSAEALRAGKVYIVVTVIGEAFLLAGLIGAAYIAGSYDMATMRQAVTESGQMDLIIAALLVGFGIKAGTIPLHVWLPLAHPVAPTAASAVLSGAMIKAGLLGWIRFLPTGEIEMVAWGTVVIVVALVSAFAGVVIGMTQEDPKTLLAYSSISQMGFITTVIAVGMAEPGAWEVALAGCLIYVLHHGLIKGVLFLGVGVAHEIQPDRLKQRLVMAGLALAGVALAGAPLTTGSVAKSMLKEGVYVGPADWAGTLDWILPIAAVGTTALMGRFLWIIWKNELSVEPGEHARGLAVPWATLLLLAFPLVWLAPGYVDLPVASSVALEADNLWTSTWPVLAGGVVLAGIWLGIARRPAEIQPIRVPAGDLLIPIQWLLGRMRPVATEEVVPRPPDPVEALSATWYGLFAESVRGDRTSRFGYWMARWDIAGVMFLAVATILITLILLI